MHRKLIEQESDVIAAQRKSIFIETTPTGSHCVRLFEVRDDGVTIMEPMDGKFWSWDWPLFEREYHALVILRRA